MSREDEEKTSFSFIIKEGTFCLRNVGATFQRLMDQVFKDRICRNVEVYIDDILVRSAKAENHVVDLVETFWNLGRVGLHLKAKKCALESLKGIS